MSKLIAAYRIEFAALVPLEHWPEDRKYKGIDPPDGFGYMHGTATAQLMFEADPGKEAALAAAVDIVRPKHGRLLHCEVTRLNPAPFHLAWFSHGTLRLGRSNDKILRDFEEFVRAAEPNDGDTDDMRDLWNHRSLMGADDRWRWKFCECEKCAAGPEVYITH